MGSSGSAGCRVVETSDWSPRYWHPSLPLFYQLWAPPGTLSTLTALNTGVWVCSARIKQHSSRCRRTSLIQWACCWRWGNGVSSAPMIYLLVAKCREVATLRIVHKSSCHCYWLGEGDIPGAPGEYRCSANRWGSLTRAERKLTAHLVSIVHFTSLHNYERKLTITPRWSSSLIRIYCMFHLFFKYTNQVRFLLK